MGALVMFMQCGFGFLEAGTTRAKNVTNILIKNVLDLSKYMYIKSYLEELTCAFSKQKKLKSINLYKNSIKKNMRYIMSLKNIL
jgi:ammonia channel protein AmtB